MQKLEKTTTMALYCPTSSYQLQATRMVILANIPPIVTSLKPRGLH